MTCTKCEGRGWKTKLYAPNPEQPRVFRPKQKTCKKCNGSGVIASLQTNSIIL